MTYLGPVEGDKTHSHAMDITKHLVDWNIIWRDPCNPGEVTEGLEKVSREEVPGARPSQCVQEEPFSGKTSSVTHTSVCLRVQGVEERTGNKVGRPNYFSKISTMAPLRRLISHLLMDGGWTRKRRAIPPIENPMSWVDITSIHWSVSTC